jgi:single-strand DNA-binding protein
MYTIRNRVQLIGHLGLDPEIKKFDSGKKVAHLRIATNEHYRDATGEKVADTQWHHVVAWNKLADIAEKYLIKGSEIAIEGKLVHRRYTDKEGSRQFITEIQVNEMLLLGKKSP